LDQKTWVLPGRSYVNREDLHEINLLGTTSGTGGGISGLWEQLANTASKRTKKRAGKTEEGACVKKQTKRKKKQQKTTSTSNVKKRRILREREIS